MTPVCPPKSTVVIARSQGIPLSERSKNGVLHSPISAVGRAAGLPPNWRYSPYGRQERARMELKRLEQSVPVMATNVVPVSKTKTKREERLTSPMEIGDFKLVATVLGDPTDYLNRFRSIQPLTGQLYDCKLLIDNDSRTGNYLEAVKRLRNSAVFGPVVGVVRQTVPIQADDEPGPDTQDCTFVFYETRPGRKSLEAIIREHGSFREQDARPIFRQVVKMVGYCHEHGIALRELKLRRLMFLQDENRGILQLSTLDDCHVFDPRKPETALIDVQRATPHYTTPESIAEVQRSLVSATKIDIWTLGVILYVMVVGRFPFQHLDPRHLLLKITACDMGAMPQHLSNDLTALLKSLLHVDPKKRPSIVEVAEHPWLQTERSENRSQERAGSGINL